MGDSNITRNVTGNVTGDVTGNLINVMRGIKSYNGEKLEDFSDWRKKDIFAVMEGQIRPTEETGDAGTDGADTGRISPSSLFTPGFLDTTFNNGGLRSTAPTRISMQFRT